MTELLLPPFKGFNPATDITQMYGVSANIYKKNYGIPYHNAIDCKPKGAPNNGYGTELIAQHDVDFIRWEEDFPANRRGSGIWLRHKLEEPFEVDGKIASYVETVRWHVSNIVIPIHTIDVTGQKIYKAKAGDVVALMGNTGQVRPVPSKACPFCGVHDHNGIRFYEDVNGIAKLIPNSMDYRPIRS